MNTKNHSIMYSALLLLFVTQACQAQMMCYVCENCAKLGADTPLMACNDEYFSTTGSTLPSTMTTSTETTTTTTASTPTTETREVSTTITTTTTDDDTETTDEPIPSPPTVGPPETTTLMPTPPNEDDFRAAIRSNLNQTTPMTATVDNATTTIITTSTTVAPQTSTLGTTTSTTTIMDDITLLTNKTYTPSTAFRQSRQVRALINQGYTYHCYSVNVNVNGTMSMERGCARVLTEQGVCSELKDSHVDAQLTKCKTCEMSKCNGSSALGVTALTMILAAVASLLNRN